MPPPLPLQPAAPSWRLTCGAHRLLASEDCGPAGPLLLGLTDDVDLALVQISWQGGAEEPQVGLGEGGGVRGGGGGGSVCCGVQFCGACGAGLAACPCRMLPHARRPARQGSLEGIGGRYRQPASVRWREGS